MRDFRYELTVTGGGDFAAEHVRVELHNVLLQKYYSNLPWVAHTETKKGRATFALRSAPGPSLLRAGDEMQTTNIERLANGQALYTRSSGTVSWGSISLPVDALAAIGTATAGYDFKPPVDVVTETPPPAAMARLLRLHSAAVSLAREAPEIIANPEAARGLEHELVQALVACLRPERNEEDAVAKRQHALVMRRFHAAVAASGDRPLYVSDLCSAIGVSDRTLRICCQEHLWDGSQEISLVAADAACAARTRARRSQAHHGDRNRHRPRLLGTGPLRGHVPLALWRIPLRDPRPGAWPSGSAT